MKKITHGTNSGYQHYKCRCLECCAAKRDYEAKRLAKKQASAEPKPAKPRRIKHGTLDAYNNESCRCDICKAFNRGYNAGRSIANSDVELEKTELILVERSRVCGTAEAYSFGCTCDLCQTKGRIEWIAESRGAP